MTNHITCPTCGTNIPIPTNAMGRKSYGIPFTKVCKALQACCGNYSATARWLMDETGINKLTPAFVWMRVKREANAREISREELLREVLESDDKAI